MNCNCNGEHHKNHKHEEVDIIYLTLEDDSELECEVVTVFDVNNKEYIALLPKGEEEVFLYEYEETEEGPELTIIEDSSIFSKVAEAYNAMLEE